MSKKEVPTRTYSDPVDPLGLLRRDWCYYGQLTLTRRGVVALAVLVVLLLLLAEGMGSADMDEERRQVAYWASQGVRLGEAW